MIRLLPVLALLLPLGARADDFEASLAAIQESASKAKIQMAQVRVVPKRPAAPAAALPAASDADWAKIIAKVQKDGKFKQGGFLTPAKFTLEEKTGDEKADHETRAVQFLGAINDDEKFEAMGAIVVVMTYKLDPATGNFNAEQWMFEVDLYGQMTDMGHMTAVMTPDGKPAAPPTPDQTLKAGDPRLAQQFEAQIKFWAGK